MIEDTRTEKTDGSTLHAIKTCNLKEETAQEILRRKASNGYRLATVDVEDNLAVFKFRETDYTENRYLWVKSSPEEASDHSQNYQSQGWTLHSVATDGDCIYQVFHADGGGER